MLLRTRLALLFVLSAALLLGIGVLVLGGWQQVHNERYNQTVVELQHIAWQRLADNMREQLRQRAVRIAEDSALQRALRDGLPVRPVVPILNTPHILEVFDARGQLRHTSSTALNQDSVLDAATLQNLLATGHASSGLSSAPERGFVFIAAQPVWQGGELLGIVSLSHSVDTTLSELALTLDSEVALFNLRGHAEAGNASARLHSLEEALVLRRAHVMVTQLDGRDWRLTTTPIQGLDGRQLGGLASVRDISAERARERWLIAGLAGTALLFIAALLGGLFVYLRQAFAPLGRALDVLTALSRGDTSVRLDSARPDEAGQIAAGVARLRSEMINLEILREERRRESLRQTRIIRDELRTLASTLDPEAQQEILDDLENAFRTPAAGADGTSDQTDGHHQLAALTFILSRLSARIRSQRSDLLQLVADLNEALKTQRAFAVLQQELEIARRMQLSVLPQVFPPRPDVSLVSSMLPAKEVGGDFYDYFLLDDQRLGVVIADVSGKGIPAAFFMAIARTLLKATARFVASPAACLARVNDLLAQENEEMMFVTVFYGVLQLDTGVFTYASGGHNPPVLLRQQEAPRFLAQPGGMALAVMEDIPYAEHALQLHSGDVLFLYTDGVTEALNPDNVLFGDQALLDTLARSGHHADVAHYRDEVISAVQNFAQTAPQADDITCTALRYAGAGSAA